MKKISAIALEFFVIAVRYVSAPSCARNENEIQRKMNFLYVHRSCGLQINGKNGTLQFVGVYDYFLNNN